MSAPAIATREGPWAQSARLAFGALLLAMLALTLGWALGNVRQVPADSRAVVLRFGAFARQQSSGLLLAWPRPVEEVVLLPSADRLLALAVTRFAPADPSARITVDTRANGAFLLTGDGGVARLQATLLYGITDPAAYILARDHVEPALERLFAAAAVQICAARDLDAILVARPGDMGHGAGGREQLRGDLMGAVNARLDALSRQGAGLGVAVRRVDLVAALPGEAKDAFDEVLRTGQAAETEIARARTYAETKAQEAAQQRAQVFTSARAAAAEAIGQARTHTVAITALTAQAAGGNGQMLLEQTYADRIARILRRAHRVDAVDPDSAHLLLPGASQ